MEEAVGRETVQGVMGRGCNGGGSGDGEVEGRL